ncbi:delta and Notch-like epidermal growth factor-related receptor [Pecten maximus]|uniref:delta and Notch-like epidermal growth factor-related receptor n=1 Tax=Pecten maximus TaxID=6579 RepID=UPI00145856B4|nr:delta and Notch-like epidermal growth factor-related receptor [Pecten maximus]
MELDKCDDIPCQNGGTCYNQVTDFMCVCPHNFIGKDCDLTYDLCLLANHCVGPDSTCSVDVRGNVTCGCSSDYMGIGCTTPKIRCETATCDNGGACSVVNKQTQCTCPSGYSGDRCHIDVDDCTSNPCPSGALCEDKINGYRCRCPNGKLGFNCEKAIQYDFDFVLQSLSVCETMDSHALFTLNSTSLSVSLWFRLSSLDGSEGDKSIASIYGFQSENISSPISQFIIRSRSIFVQVGESLSVQALGSGPDGRTVAPPGGDLEWSEGLGRRRYNRTFDTLHRQREAWRDQFYWLQYQASSMGNACDWRNLQWINQSD